MGVYASWGLNRGEANFFALDSARKVGVKCRHRHRRAFLYSPHSISSQSKGVLSEGRVYVFALAWYLRASVSCLSLLGSVLAAIRIEGFGPR